MYMNEEITFDSKKALSLAGDLAIAAEMVLKAPAFGLDARLGFMRDKLDEYNKYILRSGK